MDSNAQHNTQNQRVDQTLRDNNISPDMLRERDLRELEDEIAE